MRPIALEILSTELAPWTAKRSTVGFMISGGLDSAIMLAAACEIGRPDLFLVRTIPKHDNSWEHAVNVIAWINGRYGTNMETRPVGRADDHHAEQLSLALRQLGQAGVADVWFSAENRTPSAIPGGPLRRRSQDVGLRQPWFDLHKDQIIAVAYHIGIEDLIPLCHSCTESRYERCGMCWQCQERAWAFKCLGIEDPGRL